MTVRCSRSLESCRACLPRRLSHIGNFRKILYESHETKHFHLIPVLSLPKFAIRYLKHSSFQSMPNKSPDIVRTSIINPATFAASQRRITGLKYNDASLASHILCAPPGDLSFTLVSWTQAKKTCNAGACLELGPKLFEQRPNVNSLVAKDTNQDRKINTISPVECQKVDDDS